MPILLLTTLPNKVADALRDQADLLDCRDYATIGERLADYMAHHKPEHIITYRCPYILPREVFTKVSGGALNIHPSLLPKYKGLNPWEAIIRKKETETGVTIHRIKEQVDGGEIVMQRTMSIDPSLPLETLRAQADELAAQMIKELF